MNINIYGQIKSKKVINKNQIDLLIPHLKVIVREGVFPYLCNIDEKELHSDLFFPGP